jgi:hypothetical protein
MAFVVARFQLDDYDRWKRERFDQDPAGRQQAAKGHRILRNADDPNEVFVQVEFDSADSARSFREKLMSSGALDGINILTQPTVVEEADSQTY